MDASREISDRILIIAFGISLAVHLALLVVQFLSLGSLSSPKKHLALEVIYDYQVAQQELKQLQMQLARAKREPVATPASAALGGEPAQIRIPERPSLSAEQDVIDIMPGRSSIVDLTNLVDASRGDPVLLGYFGAVREQIQQTANRAVWLSGVSAEGLVYVSFVLTPTGMIQDATIVSDRSALVEALRNTALRIVKTAAPFPPFPPSVAEPTKTIVVPLEFLLGS